MTIPKLSKKRLAQLDGKKIYSTITASRKARKPGKAAVVRRRRTKKEFARIYGPKGYVEWIHEQPCIACGIVGFSEVAHTKTGGTGRKADWTDSIPLCGSRPATRLFRGPIEGCHARLHRAGRVTFEAAYDIDLEDAAIAIQERWLEYTNEESQ